ncbi:MAG: nucleoside permease [Bacteroidetes bacterium]|nr:nucleoside permease [Bacteroidota bacterium]MCL2302595.1 nucleoside permease [Lentimicrobiaceae bacterium]
MTLKLRLTILSFLQFFIWGAWLISLGSYTGYHLHFDGVQIGSLYAMMGIVSLFMPALLGIVADRWIPAQKMLGISHFISSCFILAASQQTEYTSLYPYMFMCVAFYMPTIGLSNSVAFTTLRKQGLDTVEAFPPIRIWGTIGFIIAMWIVDLTGFKANHYQFYLSAAAGFTLAAYSFTLPNCPVAGKREGTSWVEAFGLKAFTLFKRRKMAIFFIFAMLLGAMLQITNGFGDWFLSSFKSVPEYANTFGVKRSVLLISLSQISETFCILLIPFFFKRYGIKKVMLIAMVAWVLRFGLFGLGNPGPGVWMFILSMLVYGVAFDFFNISGSLFVDKETDAHARSGAQGLFMIMSNGLGAVIGSYAAGFVIYNRVPNPSVPDGWNTAWFIFAGYALVVAIAFALVFKDTKEK